MASPNAIDTKDPAAVAAFADSVFGCLGGDTSRQLVRRLFREVTQMFRGEYPGLQAIDMRYHDYEHTLQASVCMLHIAAGRHLAKVEHPLSLRDCELGLMAAMLHDSGYLKPTGDNVGTGAKFTFVHVGRSADFAGRYLPTLGVTAEEVLDIQHAIGCTGPVNRIATTPFRRPQARVLACALVTADYLAQMSASDYVAELPILFREFDEGYDYEKVPVEKRLFRTERALIENTPKFWASYVKPMLETNTGGMFHYLDNPDGSNDYLQAVETNIEEIRRLIAASAAAG